MDKIFTPEEVKTIVRQTLLDFISKRNFKEKVTVVEFNLLSDFEEYLVMKINKRLKELEKITT